MHSFDLGDIVTVFNQRFDGRFFIEGKEKIVGYASDINEQYFVRFLRSGKPEGRQFSRSVDPLGQNDPDAHLEMLNAAVRP